MTPFLGILLGGVAMSLIALVGSVTLVLGRAVLERLMLPLVAFAAGSLLGGAFFHMLPTALLARPPSVAFAWTAVGFSVFLALEQFLHWHHCHRASSGCHERPVAPLTWLILIGDGLHNLLGGMAVGGVFLVDVRLGVAAWLAAAAHEVPQELGDFAVLVHGGWSHARALLLNLASGLLFLVGGLLVYAASLAVDVGILVPVAAGNFLYIGASDLVPEVNRPRTVGAGLLHILAFAVGLVLLALLAHA